MDNQYHITHCIFDMDGLLLDTERIYTEVTQTILDTYADGKKFTWDVKSKLMGRTGEESAKMVVSTYGLQMTPDEYLGKISIIQEELFPGVKPLPGVEKLIKHLKEHNIPMAVATSSTREKFELKTSLNKEIFELFDVIICGDDKEIKKGKPEPDIFLEAQRRLGNPPADKCLVFEDAINGIQAGLNANMKVVWIPDENIKSLHIDEDHGATVILNSMEDFDPKMFSLPAYPTK